MRVAENTSLTESAPVRDGPIREVARPAGRFGLHLLGMCVVMCVAMGLLAVLYFGAATLMGFPTSGSRHLSCRHWLSPPSWALP